MRPPRTFHIMFDHPQIEARFRDYARRHKDQEFGGFLYLRHFPEYLHSRYVLSDLFQIPELSWANYISDVLLIPNQSKRPTREYDPVDFAMAEEIAEVNLHWHSWSYPLFFHSHPEGSVPEPSSGDLLFARRYCEMYRGCARFAIVQPKPLRIFVYEMMFAYSDVRVMSGLQDMEFQYSLSKGRFYSWLQKPLRQWRKENRGTD